MTVLLDGGMGQELRSRGVNPNTELAGSALLTEPEVVRDVHSEYVAAGAQVITTWNYAVTPQRLPEPEGDDAMLLAEMTQTAVDLASEARGNAQGVRIAGSLPPLLASYEPNGQDHGQMVAEYQQIAAYLADGVDLFICETMPSVGEAVAAATAAKAHDKPIWVALTLRDEGDSLLRSGETVDAALEALAGLPVEAVLFNCCDVAAITEALPSLRAATDLAIGAYANSFVPIPLDWKRDGSRLRDLRDCTPEEYGRVAAEWIDAGADIIGGCCGIGPAHIAHLRERLDRT